MCIKPRMETVDASSHQDGAAYAVSTCKGILAGDQSDVVKLEMMYTGRVSGPKLPSFPIVVEKLRGYEYPSCPDFDEVAAKVEEIVNPLRRWLITWDRPPGGPDVGDLVGQALMNGFTLEEDDLERPCLQVRMIEIQANGTAAEVADNIRQRLQELNAPTGVKLYVARIAEDHESLI